MKPIQSLDITITTNAGIWEGLARLVFVGASTPVVLHTSVDARAIRDMLIKRHMPEEGAVSGGFFSWIKNTVRSIARAKVFEKIGNAVKSAINSPALAAAVGVGSVFFPAIGATYIAAKAAVAAVDAVSKGVPAVVANVRQIAESAAQNNPLAAQAVEALKAAEKSPLAQFIPAIAG